MKFFVLAALMILVYSTNANAYVGPGLGAGTLAAIAGVFMSIFMAIIGVFWYPIKRLFKKGEEDKTLEEDEAQNSASNSDESIVTEKKDSQE